MAFSKSQSHYLKAVYELSSDNDGARIVDIAEKLNVSKASASFAMTKLAEQGIVYKDAARHVHLTAQGERHAVSMLDKYAVIYYFLTDTLQVDKAIATEDACAMEHVVSVDTLCALCRFTNPINSPKRCKNNCLYCFSEWT
jgi:Mn-dependent DtxR family transcriptional regulator